MKALNNSAAHAFVAEVSEPQMRVNSDGGVCTRSPAHSDDELDVCSLFFLFLSNYHDLFFVGRTHFNEMHGSTAVAQSSINDFFQSTSAARQKQSQPTKKRKSNKAEEEDHPEEPPKKKGKMKENLAPSTPISARSRNGKRTKKSLAATRPALQDKPAKRASFEHTSDPFTSIIPSSCNTHNRQSTFAEVIDLTGPESPKPSRTFRTAVYLPTPETAMKRAISSRSSPPASSTALHKRMRRTPDTAVQEANNASTPTATVLNRRAPLPTPETFDRRERKWAGFDGSSPLSSPPDSPSAGSQRSPNAKQMADPFIDSVEEVIPSSQTQVLEWNPFEAANKEEQTTNPFIDPVEELIPSSQTQVLEWNPFEAANKEEQFHYTISRAPAPSGNTNAVFKLPKLPLRTELIPSYHRAASTPPPDDEVVPSSQSQDDLLSFSPRQRASSSPSHYPPFKHDFSKGEIVPSSQSSELEMSSPRSAVKRPPLQIKIPGLVDDEVALHHDDGSAESEGEVIPTSQSPFEKEITASEALRIGEAMKKYFGHKSQDPVLEMS
ncbi:hypothetical protein EW026_g917 [Hermanssonia centrifuga]|uniref:Uncharacterized protein n=1 Tax=Hermanssonia centrifuga TaxID=98765 RepID=A0A4S4KU97_9APHY|nr:hypothetical protein EW026_g917 [Hermanssonia centrifuga]